MWKRRVDNASAPSVARLEALIKANPQRLDSSGLEPEIQAVRQAIAALAAALKA